MNKLETILKCSPGDELNSNDDCTGLYGSLPRKTGTFAGKQESMVELSRMANSGPSISIEISDISNVSEASINHLKSASFSEQFIDNEKQTTPDQGKGTDIADVLDQSFTNTKTTTRTGKGSQNDPSVPVPGSRRKAKKIIAKVLRRRLQKQRA